jgi:serine/threonine protein kinase
MVQPSFQFTDSTSKVGQWIDRDNVIRLNLNQCVNPNCLTTNPETLNTCHRCGSILQLAGRYRAMQTLGAGGFASTFKAIDEHRLGTPCVIKQFLPKQQDNPNYQKAVDLFKQEAVLLKDLGNHPQIPELMAFLEQDDRLYIVQELIGGQNLLQTFCQGYTFTETDIEQILTSLLPVLQFIHDHQVIHRDIKPSNIIRKSDGTLVLIDFGSSYQSYVRLFDRRIPRTATPGYAPPEQIEGHASPASDLFSLGLTCFRLLTGCFPTDEGVDPLFDEAKQQWRWQNHAGSISVKLMHIFEQLLHPEESRRYDCAQAVLADLAETSTCVLASGLDYGPLETLLAQQQYQAADNETWRLLLLMAHRTEQGCLSLESIDTLSTAELQTLDRLWQTYSQGRFGLTVQQQHYQALGGTAVFDFNVWETFAHQVGWCRDHHWLNYSELNFAADAPIGHLPTCCIEARNRQGIDLEIRGWWRLGFVALMEKLETSA